MVQQFHPTMRERLPDLGPLRPAPDIPVLAACRQRFGPRCCVNHRRMLTRGPGARGLAQVIRCPAAAMHPLSPYAAHYALVRLLAGQNRQFRALRAAALGGRAEGFRSLHPLGVSTGAAESGKPPRTGRRCSECGRQPLRASPPPEPATLVGQLHEVSSVVVWGP